MENKKIHRKLCADFHTSVCNFTDIAQRTKNFVRSAHQYVVYLLLSSLMLQTSYAHVILYNGT